MAANSPVETRMIKANGGSELTSVGFATFGHGQTSCSGYVPASQMSSDTTHSSNASQTIATILTGCSSTSNARSYNAATAHVA